MDALEFDQKTSILWEIGTSPVPSWNDCRKVKGLRAKHMKSVLTDSSVLGMFLLNTLEGREPVDGTSMICVGPMSDVWQQRSANLFKKYNAVGVDEEGWFEFVPKTADPNAPATVECIKVTPEFLRDMKAQSAQYVQGTYGETIQHIENLQQFKLGDYICRDKINTHDVWVVADRIFLNTYEVDHST